MFSAFASKKTLWRQRERPGHRRGLDNNPKGSIVQLPANHTPKTSPVPQYDGWRYSATNQPCSLQRSRSLGTSTATWENTRCYGYMHASGTSSPRGAMVTTRGTGKTGQRVVVTLFPGLRTWWWRGVRDASGKLLSILSVFILATAQFWIF